MAAPILDDLKTTPPGSGRLGRVLLVAAICLGIFQTAQLFWFINRYAVDVPYWDQWDYYNAFFTPHTLWQIFAWQHGPHRQGIGFFLTWMVNELTDWNQRAQCFTIGLVMLSAALAALWLKRRLFGSLNWYDLIPVFFILSLGQWELYVSTPNVSHGALPLLLIVLSGLAWTLGNVYLRYGLVLILGFLATYTGFGMFVGMVNLLLLTGDIYQAARQHSRGRLLTASIALALAASSLASFYIGYRFAPAVPNFTFPDPNWPLYPAFMSLQFAGLFGVLGSGLGPITVGFVIMAGLLAILVLSAAKLLRVPSQDPPARVIFFLLAFAFAFSANAAIGRLCQGLGTAASSRYYPLLVPAGLGLYFALLTRPAGRTRDTLILLLLLTTMFAAMPVRQRPTIEAIFHGKTRWVAAYLETQKVAAANAKAGSKVYPLESKRFRVRLAWLRAHHYSLFRDAAIAPLPARVGPATAPATAPAAAAGQ